ncbi:MAG TPA: YtxH domain-containing protein [Brumimicrobium sp.]|nr:YtxH domain-containing protein [Brumimicrobium sp.]
MEDTGKIIVAALAGAVVGAGVALLLAPQSGKETRGMIADKYGDAKDATKNAIGNAKDAIGDAKDAIIDKGDELLKKAHLKS